MDNKIRSKYFRDKGLLPFQMKFVESFIAEDLPFRQFVSPVGTGKTRMAAALITYAIEALHYKRILVMSSRTVLLHQWRSVLISMLSPESQAASPIIVDRNKYLNLELGVSPGESPWPASGIILMSIDFAKRDDIASSIMSVVWDLVIFDESHLLRGKRRTLLDLLVKSGTARRILLLASSLSGLQGVVTSQYKYTDIIDWNQRPLFPSIRKKLVTIYYGRTDHELVFWGGLREFVHRLETLGPFGKLQRAIVIRNASSSIFTIERTLRRLRDAWNPVRNSIAHRDAVIYEDMLQKVPQEFVTITDLFGDIVDTDDKLTDVGESRFRINLRPDQFLDLYNNLESLLDQIEDIGTDSKLEALISYLHKSNTGSSHICILTSFIGTLHYLGSGLQEISKPLYVMSSASQLTERQTVLNAFRGDGGILIMTDAALVGVSLEFVHKCVNYDLPADKHVFEQRWGRFLRSGRHSEFEMIIMKDEANLLPWEEELTRSVEETLNE